MRAVAIALACALALGTSSALARSTGSSHEPQSANATATTHLHKISHSGTHGASHAGSHKGAHAAAGVRRDSDGRIHGSTHAKDEFEKAHPCPSTGKSTGACQGYVIDHFRPLARGGPDSASNMQWQTIDAAKARDENE